MAPARRPCLVAQDGAHPCCTGCQSRRVLPRWSPDCQLRCRQNAQGGLYDWGHLFFFSSFPSRRRLHPTSCCCYVCCGRVSLLGSDVLNHRNGWLTWQVLDIDMRSAVLSVETDDELNCLATNGMLANPIQLLEFLFFALLNCCSTPIWPLVFCFWPFFAIADTHLAVFISVFSPSVFARPVPSCLASPRPAPSCLASCAWPRVPGLTAHTTLPPPILPCLSAARRFHPRRRWLVWSHFCVGFG